ncbi:MAG: diguanylate cyclase [Candidatus Electryonea clarkiae]|nr:diguanylate cyclase [Candidatus Electryonea clarkiae]MDP8286791.1 diguanylate cyclase [Candidatus Electryonea clarkiae]
MFEEKGNKKSKEKDNRSNLLVVDDDSEVRGLMRQVLEAEGTYDIIEAEDGIDALEKLEQNTFDMVISDVKMPNMDGIELLKEIRKTSPDLPVIIATAYGGDMGPKALSLGADDFLYLPFRIEEFKFRVERVLGYSKLLKVRETLEKENKELWGRAITDKLTGLFNRQYFEEIFSGEFERSKRYRSHLGCVMLDIDLFKEVNDQYGHLVGDVVLKELGVIISDTLRRADLAVRYGGEEFVILLPETTREGIALVADRLRNKVEEFKFCSESKLQGKKMRQVTISLGASYYPDSRWKTEKDFLQAADEKLYLAKEKGRNRLELAWNNNES